ncbi:hypothetical protein H4O18_04010 [Arenibacter sp. BSSL-BM3]|uniref:Alpha/beta hydrolase n=1 Tax=Arenibacter arenosicollis TaxID=2762274 RepID=A0ABR7QJ06_9FLAO|nr:hypothetical protein [Arenibacter arenosicollis]MBC8767150.1 hypothetical protein [Arenibacter arenosicollis]
MANRLVILSDMWGSKKGLWITSYLGYLQQYYNITFYDCQHLADISLAVDSPENIQKEFIDGGVETAVAHLLKKENEPSHYLAFGIGGTIAWKAALKGLPMKSLYAISSTRLRLENHKPQGNAQLLYGQHDEFRPTTEWSVQLGVELEIVKNFGHELYTDEKIISKVCQDLLAKVMQKQSVA